MLKYYSHANKTFLRHVIGGAKSNCDDDFLSNFGSDAINSESPDSRTKTLVKLFINNLNDALVRAINKHVIPKETGKQLLIFVHACIFKPSHNIIGILRRIYQWLGIRLGQAISRSVKGHSYNDLTKVMSFVSKHFNLDMNK